MHELNIAYIITAIKPQVVPGPHPLAVGHNYSLHCNVTEADSLGSTINYHWFRSDTNWTQVGTNSSTLIFNPLVLSDAGDYICQVIVGSAIALKDITITSSVHHLQFSGKLLSDFSSGAALITVLSFYLTCILF